MDEYSQNEIIRFFNASVKPALERLESELVEHGWPIENIQIPNLVLEGNTLTTGIWATKKEGFIFSYEIRAELSPKNAPNYCLQFKYGCSRGDVGNSNVTDHYKPNIYTVTADDFLEHIKEVYNNSIGMIQ
jgi:hypothetical protein